MAQGRFQSDRTSAHTPVSRYIAKRQQCESSKTGHTWIYWDINGETVTDNSEPTGRTCTRCDTCEALDNSHKLK
jgi:hypothetical protein